MHTDATKPVEDKQTSYCDKIRSRGWRGSTLSNIRRGLSSVDGPVSTFIDGGVVWEQLGLYWAFTPAYGLRCFSQHALDWLKTGHDTAGRPSAFGPCDHMADCTRTTLATIQGLTAARFLHTHFTILGLGKSNPRVLWTASTYWPDTPKLQAHAASHRHGAHMVLVLPVCIEGL